MFRVSSLLRVAIGLILTASTGLFADATEVMTITPLPEKTSQITSHNQQTPQAAPTPTFFTPFTGKVTKNKVRLRLQPTLESAILRELNSGDMIVILGETDEFFAVETPPDVKAYIFRTYVLDGIVEGNRVNVRLEPDLSSPVLTQMNSGDPVLGGGIYSKDKRWIEFTPPPSTRFYVSREFIEKVGDRNYISFQNHRREEVNTILNTTDLAIQTEMQKPFEQINLDDPARKLNKVIKEYSDFPEQAEKAKSMLAAAQEAYMLRKLASMEAKVHAMENAKQQQFSTQTFQSSAPNQSSGDSINIKRTAWHDTEQRIFEKWALQNPENPSIDDFYKEQANDAVALQGVIEQYNRPVRNRPGDFLLLNESNHLPIAYIYGTHINLQDKIGQKVKIQALHRDNHNFAFPAYFVLSIDQP